MTPRTNAAADEERRRLPDAATGLHDNAAAENDASAPDGAGQGGQQHWVPPATAVPTASPATGAPTGRPVTGSPSAAPAVATAAPTTAAPSLGDDVAPSPSREPTLRGAPHVLRGVAWYDRNANGRRDANVDVSDWKAGEDVERSYGVGGVSVRLAPCDEETGREHESENEEALETTMTQGFDARFVPQIVQADGQNGKYNLYIKSVERWYHVDVQAPEGYLFTEGICNDEEEGWECDRSGQSTSFVHVKKTGKVDKSIGVQSGRSASCVYVDGTGNVDGPINFGVMRESDIQKVAVRVALVLEFASAGDGGTPPQSDAVRHLLGERDDAAIGTVTAEVLAAALDRRLAEEGVTLDAVDPRNVVLSEARPSDGAAAGGYQLAVGVEVKGHYSPPPELNFGHIVEDSINRDTDAIRRGLREYNDKCRGEKLKANDRGLEEALGSASTGDDVLSPACSSGLLVPDYVETDLRDIRARKVSEVKLRDTPGGNEVHNAAEAGGAVRLEKWAVGPVAGIAGMIVLLAGALVFRRALPRRAADGRSSPNRTERTDLDEGYRFGEAGGAAGDSFVSNSFVSDGFVGDGFVGDSFVSDGFTDPRLDGQGGEMEGTDGRLDSRRERRRRRRRGKDRPESDRRRARRSRNGHSRSGGEYSYKANESGQLVIEGLEVRIV